MRRPAVYEVGGRPGEDAPGFVLPPDSAVEEPGVRDARVVISQPQEPTSEVKDERLVPADLPILQFREAVRLRLQVVQD